MNEYFLNVGVYDTHFNLVIITTDQILIIEKNKRHLSFLKDLLGVFLGQFIFSFY